VLASLAIGALAVAPDEVWRAVTGSAGTPGELVVRGSRVPRTLVGLAAGAALGIAGAVVQGHTRNPLADPGLLGVSAGAALVVVIGIGLGVTAIGQQAWLALAGALVASLVVFVVGGTRGASATPATLALVGAALSALLTGITSALLLLDTTTLDAFRFWTVGSIAGRGLDGLATVAPFLLAGLVAAIANVPALDALVLGDEVATSLGQRVAVARGVGVAAVALLTAGAVAVAGPLVFVGLVAPHLARALVGHDMRALLPASALAGAVVVLVADVVGRVVLPPSEVQAGIVVAFVGAPVFFALVRRRRLAGL
jgi:iron complex transport system permease protein